ncbi:MAG: hypothetical protein PUE67_00910 [Oscillospiraceae bacterium]|nr:hypothetical protein [Oscillospiraceae bacterium]
MKKILVLMISIVMVFSFTACGGNDEKGGSSDSGNAYNLDMKSTEAQPMATERASADVLRETAQTYFGGMNYFEGTEQADYTYDDVKEHIGVDASEYKYDEERQAELYIWYVDGDDKAMLNVWFVDGKLNASGAMNLI